MMKLQFHRFTEEIESLFKPSQQNFEGINTAELVDKLVEWKNCFDYACEPAYLFEWENLLQNVEQIQDQFLKNSIKIELEKIEKNEKEKYFSRMTEQIKDSEIAKILLDETETQEKVFLDEIDELNSFDEKPVKRCKNVIPTWYNVEQKCFKYWDNFGFYKIRNDLNDWIDICKKFDEKNGGRIWFKDCCALYVDPKKTLFDLFKEINHVYENL
jgi:hypothetical protein